MSGQASSPLANFHFTTIGKEPSLLQRFSAPEDGGQPQIPPSSSPSPVSSPRASALSVLPPTSRKSLLEDLAGIEEPMPIDTRCNEATTGATSSTRPSGTHAAVGALSQPTSLSDDRTPLSSKPSGIFSSTSHKSNTDPHSIAQTSRPFARSDPLLTPHLPQSPEQGYSGQDDAMSAFRRALQRLQEESEEYARREKEAREAIALQQRQAMRWHTRAETLLESLGAAFVQCEQRMASAGHAVEEADRLRNIVRQFETKETGYCHELESLSSQNGILERAKEANEVAVREAQKRVDELDQAMVQIKQENARLLDELKASKAAERYAREREQQLLAQLEELKRTAAQDKTELLEQKRKIDQENAELLEQLQKAKRVTDADGQRRMAGLEPLLGQLRTPLDAHRSSGDAEEGRRQGDSSRSDGNHVEASTRAGLPSRPPKPSTVDRKPTAGAASHMDLKPLNIPQTTNHSVVHTSPVHGLPIKPEFSTPAFRSVAPMHRGGPPPSTPTALWSRPELMKSEQISPFIERQLRPAEEEESEVEAALRRGQSLDYHPSVAQSSRTPPPVPPPSRSIPSSTDSYPAPTSASLHQDSVVSRVPSGLEGNARASESSAFPPQPAVPNLTYPSRSPSQDADNGLGQFDARSGGPFQTTGQHSRSRTPPPEPGPARRGRGPRMNQRVGNRNASPPASRAVDHWSPTPGRPPLYREPDASPERFKRPRDEDDSSEGSVPRRRRVDSPVAESSYSGLPPHPRPPASYEREPSAYDDRNPSPPAPSEADRFYNAQRNQYSPHQPPRRRSPTPPPPPASTSANDPYSSGWWPPRYRSQREDRYDPPMPRRGPANPPRRPLPPQRMPLEARLADPHRYAPRRWRERSPY
ncbi:hypothetical protein PYCCODRAFT_764770 [Trametes coccinea BRFM310]|uniref:Uncharacterized protein n=1 Tax=Trametes coccinea (strain BRFM310) TaxID=1353009 RepID=A0A1Y2J1L3_TRAC3|nr:hypothetical protein PYCCODRAFT_764770 [Trametes coccinea BRFM310]